MVMNLLGLDVSTTGYKALLLNSDGALFAKALREYAVDFPHPLWAEQDLEDVWRLAQEAIREVIAIANVTEIAAIGLPVNGAAVALVDKTGCPLRPTILGMDTRTGPQNAWLRERFGGESLFRRTGMPIHTSNTLPKPLWILENKPEIWQAAGILAEAFETYFGWDVYHHVG